MLAPICSLSNTLIITLPYADAAFEPGTMEVKIDGENFEQGGRKLNAHIHNTVLRGTLDGPCERRVGTRYVGSLVKPIPQRPMPPAHQGESWAVDLHVLLVKFQLRCVHRRVSPDGGYDHHWVGGVMVVSGNTMLELRRWVNQSNQTHVAKMQRAKNSKEWSTG